MTAEMMTIKIGEGIEKDISELGMELISSPQAFGSEIKQSNMVKIDFPEEDGDVFYIPESPKLASFEYKIRLAFVASSNESVAEKINSFILSVLGKKLIIKNKFKGVKIEGYFTKYADAEYYKDKKAATFDIIVYVPSGKAEVLT